MLKSPSMMFGGGDSPFSVFVSMLLQNSAFSFGALGAYTARTFSVLFAGQLSVKLRVLPSVIILRFVGMQLILFLLVTKTMPLDLGFSRLCECTKWRFGWYCEFSFLICSSSECDS